MLILFGRPPQLKPHLNEVLISVSRSNRCTMNASEKKKRNTMAQNDYGSRILRCVKNTTNGKIHTQRVREAKKDNQTQSTLVKCTRNDKNEKEKK